MRSLKVTNLTRPLGGPLRVTLCASFLCRLRGLTFRRAIDPREGLLLDQGRENRLDSAIHMLGVFTDLAVVWVNQEGRVVDRRLARRWRPVYVPRDPARYVLETAPGRLEEFQIGDLLRFDDAPVD